MTDDVPHPGGGDDLPKLKTPWVVVMAVAGLIVVWAMVSEDILLMLAAGVPASLIMLFATLHATGDIEVISL